MKKYDYLIVGAGLFGAVFAHEASRRGKTCLVIDKKNHIGGNIYTEEVEGIQVHRYGAHIFHTSRKQVWDYLPLVHGQTLGSATGLYSLVVGFALSILCIVIFSLCTKKPSQEILAEFDEVKNWKE